ncbi:MAG: hypothetical protein M1324_00295 [Patescibacteria group bacterium]|nr:hypothetical protein [Patescibacteria group bacterium]
MAVLPHGYGNTPWFDQLTRAGLKRVSVGKVREGYTDDSDPDRSLFLASDRVSIFNFVLPALVPRKGEVLTALSHFVMTNVLADLASDMVFPERDSENDKIWHNWRRLHPEIPWERCTLVNKYDVQPFEAIFRRHPGGSIWGDYLKSGVIAGQKLPAGLVKWECLNKALFTPTEKSEEDEPLTIQQFLEVNSEYGQAVIDVLSSAYDRAYEFFQALGIRILDTKFEYAIDESGNVVLLDEKFTPDSSRFVEEANWLATLGSGSDPAFQDKEIVRSWGKAVGTPFYGVDGKQIIGLHNLKGSNSEHIAFVHGLTVPGDLLEKTSQTYLSIFQRVTSCDLDAYQRESMKCTAV